MSKHRNRLPKALDKDFISKINKTAAFFDYDCDGIMNGRDLDEYNAYLMDECEAATRNELEYCLLKNDVSVLTEKLQVYVNWLAKQDILVIN